MTSFSFLCYVFIPLLLLVTTLVVLRRNRGMKSKNVYLMNESQFEIWENEQEGVNNDYKEVVGEPKLVVQTSTPTFLQEKDNPTTEERE